MLLIKEFPEIKINYDYAINLAQRKVQENKWPKSKIQLLRFDNFEIMSSENGHNNETGRAQILKYYEKTPAPYILTEEERALSGVHCERAALLKTNPNISVYIHREQRGTAINFPLIFEPGKTSVAFYDDDRNELARHTVIDKMAVRFEVSQWHAVHNTSQSIPRVVLTCSKFIGKWAHLQNQ